MEPLLTDVSKLIEISEVEFGGKARGNRGRNYSDYCRIANRVGSSRGAARWSKEKGWQPRKIRSAFEFSWLEADFHIVHVSCVLARDQGRDRSPKRPLYFFPFLFRDLTEFVLNGWFVRCLKKEKERNGKFTPFNPISVIGYDVGVIFLNYLFPKLFVTFETWFK